MKLIELEPEFLKILDDRTFQRSGELVGADGLFLLCPVCFKANNGPVGTHGIICWQPHVPQTIEPVPGRWKFEGSGFHDLTLVAGSSSILLQGAECKAHFFIRNGEIC